MSDATTPGPVGNHYDKYASQNAVERRMMDGFLATLDSMVDDLAPLSVLEVGVGEGEVLQRITRRFPNARTIGIDLPDDELAAQWSERGIVAEFGDVCDLRFADEEFDLVLAIEVLEHVDRPGDALREIARVCSGHAVLSVPREPVWRLGNMARGRYLREFGNTPGHVNHWGRRSFARAVAEVFDVQRVASPIPWTMVRAAVRGRRVQRSD